jgi:hypothetical protein
MHGINTEEDKHIAGLESLVYSVAEGNIKTYRWVMNNMSIASVANYMLLKIRMRPDHG